MADSILEVVAKVFVEVRDIDPSLVVLEASLTEDLGADSLDSMEIVLKLEEYYDKELAGEDISALKTVGDVVALIERMTA